MIVSHDQNFTNGSACIWSRNTNQIHASSIHFTTPADPLPILKPVNCPF